MSDTLHDDSRGLRGLTSPARNRYFYGKLLDVQHFEMEQRYGNDKRWLLNRLGLGSGVVCGLKLSVAGGRIVLSPGVAIDGLGREIIVPAAVPIDPFTLTDDCGAPSKTIPAGNVTICLAYHPCATEMVPVLTGDCETRDGCAASTIREMYAVLVHEGAPPPLAPDCPIPGLFHPPAGQTHAAADEFYAQLVDFNARECSVPAAETCVVLGSIALPVGAPLTDASVRTAGRRVVVGQATLLQLLLCLWERVEECCSGGMPSPTPAPTPPLELLKLGNVRVLRSVRGRQQEVVRDVVAERVDLSRPVPIRVEDEANTIEFDFVGAPVDFGSTTLDTILVTSLTGRQPANPNVVRMPGNAVRWTCDVIPQGIVRVVLVGRGTPMITSRGRVPLALDGEPSQLPSGDDQPGGDFTFELEVRVG